MALEDLTPQISVAILETLRANSITTTTINNDFDSTVRAEKGAEIDINELKPMGTREITPGNISPEVGRSAVDSYPSKLTLDFYEEVSFTFTDRMFQELVAGTFPEALVKATETLVERVEETLLQTMAAHAYQFVGTPGTTPFTGGTLTEATQAFRFLSSAKARSSDRYMGLDPFAYAQALEIPALQNVNQSGMDETLRNARITRAINFNWYQNQGFTTQQFNNPDPIVVDAGAAVDATTILIDDGAGGIPAILPIPGINFQFAGHTQPYAIVSVTPQVDDVAIVIAPRLQAPVADGETITYLNTVEHTANFAYHKDAIWMASRLPASDVPTNQTTIQVVEDSDISNLAFSYEITREHHQTEFKLYSLWGFVVPRPQLLVKIMG